MSIQSVLLPVAVEITLIFLLLAWLAIARQRAFAAGLAPRDIALSGETFPAASRQIANCYANQFELPVLFCLAVIFAIVLHRTGWFFVLCEWVFVLCRLAHAAVHTTSNIVPLRGALFLGSAIATALMWGLVFVGVFFGTSLV